MACAEAWIVLDCEFNGSNPRDYDMIQFACVLVETNWVDHTAVIKDRFSRCLEATKPMEARCMTEFWQKHMDTLKWIRKNAIDPLEAMKEFDDWYYKVKAKYGSDKVFFVGRPTCQDWSFMSSTYGHYLKKSLGHNIFCLSTAMRVANRFLDTPDYDNIKDSIPENIRMTHNAIEDAHYQAHWFINFIKTINKW